MKRRDFLKSAAGGAAAVTLAGVGLAEEARRPNVLIITTDQHRYPVWTPDGISPNLDGLAARGVSFDHNFVSASPCSPSRACLFTGTYTTQNLMYSNCDFVDGKLQPSLNPKIPTMGHLFRDNGYRTPYRGKWHLTRRADRNKEDPLIDYGFEGWKPPEAFFGGPPYGGKTMDPVYSGQAIDWLKDPENHKQPWLLVCSLVNPHDVGPWPRYYPQTKLKSIETESVPPNWDDDLSQKPGAQKEFQQRMEKMSGKIPLDDKDMWRRYLDWYCQCIRDVDAHIGRVLDALDKSGQRDNTIVVMTSDHGEMAGSHKLRNKGPFAYEEVMKVPLIMSLPGVIPEGVTSHAMVSNVDLLPTLAAMCGLKADQYMAGRDFSHVLRDPSAPARDEIIYHNDWEIVYTVGKDEGDNSMYQNPAHVRCLRNRDWKFAYYFSPRGGEREYELYNLKDDPLEMHNLAADPGYQSVRKEMQDHLDEEEKRLASEFSLAV